MAMREQSQRGLLGSSQQESGNVTPSYQTQRLNYASNPDDWIVTCEPKANDMNKLLSLLRIHGAWGIIITSLLSFYICDHFSPRV